MGIDRLFSLDRMDHFWTGLAGNRLLGQVLSNLDRFLR